MSPDSQKANVPFELQSHLLSTTWLESICWLHDLIEEALDDWGPEEKPCGGGAPLYELARFRLEDGYNAYGSEMYTWGPEHRLRNVMEELADALVYLSSGPVE
jgi:hypothetical protein